jgi:hypothetical protein
MIRIVMIDIAHTLADAVSGQPEVRHEEVLSRVMPGRPAPLADRLKAAREHLQFGALRPLRSPTDAPVAAASRKESLDRCVHSEKKNRATPSNADRAPPAVGTREGCGQRGQ